MMYRNEKALSEAVESRKVLLRRAIKLRQVVRFRYKGKIRDVEPFLIGKLMVSDNEALSAWQVGGFSKSEKLPPWRLYLIEGMEELQMIRVMAKAIRPDYNPFDSRMSQIDTAA